MTVKWRSLWTGLAIGAVVGLLIGIAAPRNSYAGVAALYFVALIALLAAVLLFFARSRPLGAVLLLAAFAFLATSWGAMILRGI